MKNTSIEKQFMDAAESMLGGSDINYNLIELVHQSGDVFGVKIFIEGAGTYLDNFTLIEFKVMLNHIREQIVAKPLTCPECGKVQYGQPDSCVCGTLFFYSEICSPNFHHPIIQYSGFFRAVANMTDDDEMRKALKTFVSLGGELGEIVKGFHVIFVGASDWPIFCYKPHSRPLNLDVNTFKGENERFIFAMARLCEDTRWHYKADCVQNSINGDEYHWLIENNDDFELPVIIHFEEPENWHLSVDATSDIEKIGFSEAFYEKKLNDDTINDECIELMVDGVIESNIVSEVRVSHDSYYSIQIGDISEIFALPVLDQGLAIHRLLEEKLKMLISEISAIQKRIEADIVQS